jgi:hypothetical protein
MSDPALPASTARTGSGYQFVHARWQAIWPVR